MSLSSEFLSYFESIEDPRVQDRNIRHKLEDIFAITILAVICGADNWVEIINFAHSKEEWLQEFLELPGGIPSHDTLGRVFALLDAAKFEQCFSDWAHSLPILMQENGKIKKEIIAIKPARAKAGDKAKLKSISHALGNSGQPIEK